MQSVACGRTVLTKASVDSSRINVWKGQEERRGTPAPAQELQRVDVELGWRDTQTSARGPPAARPQTLTHAGRRPCPGVHRGPAPP